MADTFEDVSFLEEAVDLLLPQFRNSNNIKGILEGSLTPLEENLPTVDSIKIGLDIDNITGEMLDNVGKLFNISRADLTDQDFKDSIQAKIYINSSNGTISSLVKVLNDISGTGNYSIIESFPAEVQVRLYKPQSILTDEIISDLLPIGVKGVFLQNPYIDKDPWLLTEVGGAAEPLSVLPEVADLSTTNLVIIDVIFS